MLKKYNLTKEIIDQLAFKVNGNNRPVTRNVNDGTMNRVKQNVYRGHGISRNQDNNYNPQNPQNGKHHILAVFTGTDVGVEESIRELNEGKKYGITYDIAVSESAEAILELDYLKTHLKPERTYTERDKLITDEVIENVSGIIVPMTTQNTVAKLSLGIQDSFISFALWQSLWHGKPVLIDFENAVKYRGNYSKQPVLQNIINDYVTKLGKMGVKKVERQGYVSELLKALNIKANNNSTNQNIQNNSKNTSSQNTSSTQRVIITDKDLKQMANQGEEIIVPRKSIVTPLAYDTAKELGIKIIKE